MKIAYFDCFSGISGDMCLGALISAGVDFNILQEELSKLSVHGYSLRCEKVKRNGINAVNFFVDLLDVEQPERGLLDIKKIIDNSDLPERVKERSNAVFERLALAEASVHDTTPEHIHFHEVGAVDAIVDVVGTVLGLNLLGVQRVYASPLPMGKGFIKCQHGIIPSPAPATLEILKDVPIYGSGVESELVTPTGAALISALADDFIDLPALVIKKVGYGSGKIIMERPNVLRLIIGEKHEQYHHHPLEHKHGNSHNIHSHQHGHSHR